jgi:hypothetical protein
MYVCCWSARALFPDFDPLCSAPATAGEYDMLQFAPAAVKIGSVVEAHFLRGCSENATVGLGPAFQAATRSLG